MSSRVQVGPFILVVLLFALVVVPPLWLDHAPQADAVVTRKYEGYRLDRAPDGGWRRRLSVWTEFATPAGAVHNSQMMLGDTDYDGLSVGSHLRVRYLPIYPYTTRPVARTSLVQARDLLTPHTTLGHWGALLAGFGILILVVGCFTRAGALVVAAVWLAATWMYVLQPVAVPVPGPVHTSARVSWSEVQRKGLSRGRSSRLTMPYRIVALTFVPANTRDSITVLDAVDSTSVAAPVNGTLQPIGYEPGSPRTARLLTGSRTFVNANRFDYYVLGLAPIGLGLLFSRVLWKRRRRPRAGRLRPAVAAP
jgi:hypothetical protein